MAMTVGSNVIARNEEFLRNREQKLSRRVEATESSAVAECTFQPKISRLGKSSRSKVAEIISKPYSPGGRVPRSAVSNRFAVGSAAPVDDDADEAGFTNGGMEAAEQGYSAEVDSDASPPVPRGGSAVGRLHELKLLQQSGSTEFGPPPGSATGASNDNNGEPGRVIARSGAVPSTAPAGSTPSLRQRQKEQVDAYLKRMEKARALAESARNVPHKTGAGYTGTLTIPQVSVPLPMPVWCRWC